MEAWVLLGSFFLLILIGTPVAYAMGMAALIGACPPGILRVGIVWSGRVTFGENNLRATSLDELPQIFNVLSGEMSLVGPRPHAIGMKTGHVESARLVADYAHRHRIKPGMTGWAAVNGSRGPLHTAQDVRRRVQLDIDYVERQSLWMDLWIMAITVPVLLGDRAAVR